jgi:hypothetical protein
MRKLLISIIICFAMAIGLSVLPARAFNENFPNINYKTNVQFNPKNIDYYDGNLRLQLKERADIERATEPNRHYDKYTGEYYWCSWKYNTNLGTWVCNRSETKPRPDTEYPSNKMRTAYAQPARSAVSPSQTIQIQACPYGYVFKTATQGCAPVTLPKNAELSANGNGWECKIGYRVNSTRTACELIPANTTYSYTSGEGTQYQVTRYAYYYTDNSSNSDTPVVRKPVRLPSTGAGVGYVLISGLIGTLGYVLKRKIF